MESIFGWMETVGGFRRSRYRGVERTRLCGELVVMAYNLVRMSRLIAEEKTEVPVFASALWPRFACHTLGRWADCIDRDCLGPHRHRNNAVLCGQCSLYLALRAVLPQPAKSRSRPPTPCTNRAHSQAASGVESGIRVRTAPATPRARTRSAPST